MRSLLKRMLLCFISIAPILTTAQETEKPKPSGYISLNSGLGIPTGSYRSNYASLGRNTNLSFAMPIKTSRWGFSSFVGAGSNNFNISSFVAKFSADNAGGSCKATSYNNYATLSFLVGAFYTIPFKRFNFDFVLQTGGLFSNYPSVSLELTDNTYTTYTVSVGSASDLSVPLNMGAGMRYSFTKRFALCANIGWLTSDATYRNILITSSTQDIYGNTYTSKQYVSMVKHISIVNITAGIAWQIR